jgi:hypothetical protein
MTTSTPTTTTPARDTPARSPGLTWWQATATGAVAATAVNLVILLIAQAADASLVLRQPGAASHEITAGGVIISSAIPMTAGIVLATLLALLWSGFLRLAQVVGGGLALLTVAGPINSHTDTVTQVALAVMHVVVGVTVVLALEAIRRRRKATAST